MPRSEPAARLDLPAARRVWHRKQGLAGVRGAPHEILGRTGWIRTLGGVDVYLALRARSPRLDRAEADAAAAARDVTVLPAVRGCIYLIPHADSGLALAFAEDQARPRLERDCDKAGVELAELEVVGEAALEALAAGPMTPDALRKALPDGVVRSLGDRGKKVGMSSTLPVALRLLEFAGRVQRGLAGGRLDSERYAWGLPSRELPPAPGDAASRLAAVAERFVRHHGPVTTKELATWAGASQRDVKGALATLPVAPVAVDGHAGETWVLDDELAALEDLAAPLHGEVALLPMEDNLLVVHGGTGPLVDAAHHGVPVRSWGSRRPHTLGDAKHVGQRMILVDGEAVGFWELDPAAGEVVTGLFSPTSHAIAARLADLAAATARFLVDELGHGRSFSLDTDAALAERAAAVRTL